MSFNLSSSQLARIPLAPSSILFSLTLFVNRAQADNKGVLRLYAYDSMICLYGVIVQEMLIGATEDACVEPSAFLHHYICNRLRDAHIKVRVCYDCNYLFCIACE